MLAAEQPSICQIILAWHIWGIDYVQMQHDLLLNGIANALGFPEELLSTDERRRLAVVRGELRDRRMESV